jgi:hypothetical protein
MDATPTAGDRGAAPWPGRQSGVGHEAYRVGVVVGGGGDMRVGCGPGGGGCVTSNATVLAVCSMTLPGRVRTARSGPEVGSTSR